MRWFVLLFLCVSLALSISLTPACSPEPTPDGTKTEPPIERPTDAEPPASRDLSSEQPVEHAKETPQGQDTVASEPSVELAKEAPADASTPLPEGQGEFDGPCGCATWQSCVEGSCTSKSCEKSEDCGEAATCVERRCRSKLECCEVNTSRCSQRREEKCLADANGCGKWTNPTQCATGGNCHRGSCQPCRHRACANNNECCNGTTCSFGYCLVLCDASKGDLDNPDCQKREFCFPVTSGGPPVCIPDGNEPKGAACSIVKPCGSGLSCVNVANKGFKCYADCAPSKGTVGNPDCGTSEQCGQVAGATRGGICVPFAGQGKKLHEACDQTNPCIAPNLCIGEPGSGKTYCLAPCDPTANPSTCPASDECVAYDASTPKKGVCLQRCSNAGVVDNCKYGLCRDKNPLKVCL